MMATRVHRWLLPVVALTACAGPQVQQGGPQRTALMLATGSETTATSVRAMTNLLAISVPGTIEDAADEMAAASPDAATKRRALLWKIELIPAFYQAFFYSDPLAAGLDAWSLALQLEDAVTTGAWRERLGTSQPTAIDMTHRVRMQIENALRDSPVRPEGFARARATVEGWVQEHPIVGPVFSRPSILPDLVRLAGAGLDVSIFQAVASIPATLADLATRIDIYAAYLPKAARWQAELMAGNVAESDEARRALATLASADALVRRTNELISPAGLRDALEAGRGGIEAQRVAALAAVDEQRVATLSYLTGERVAAVADLARERDALLRQVNDLRRQAVSDVDELSDRAIRKASLAVAGLLVLAAALALAVLWLAPRGRPVGRGDAPGAAPGPTA